MFLTIKYSFGKAIKYLVTHSRISAAMVGFLAFAYSSMYCPKLAAETAINDSHFPVHFWNKHAKSTEINIVSPSQMNDKQLLKAAQVVRDTNGIKNAVKCSQRLINNMWLTLEASRNNMDVKKLGQILSFGKFSYKRGLTEEEKSDPLIATNNVTTEDTLIRHFDNYALEISPKSLVLSIHRKL